MTSMWELLRVWQSRNFVILDTETTGLEFPAEICSIAILDHNKVPLLDTLVKPRGGIPNEASRVHGITNIHTENAPEWPAIQLEVRHLLRGKDVIVYNAQFDRKIMHYSDRLWDLRDVEYKNEATYYCAMEAYAEFWGDRHPYYGSFRWQKLGLACVQQGLMPSGEHTAIGDCYSTYKLMRHMCAELLARQDLENSVKGGDGGDANTAL